MLKKIFALGAVFAAVTSISHASSISEDSPLITEDSPLITGSGHALYTHEQEDTAKNTIDGPQKPTSETCSTCDKHGIVTSCETSCSLGDHACIAQCFAKQVAKVAYHGDGTMNSKIDAIPGLPGKKRDCDLWNPFCCEYDWWDPRCLAIYAQSFSGEHKTWSGHAIGTLNGTIKNPAKVAWEDCEWWEICCDVCPCSNPLCWPWATNSTRRMNMTLDDRGHRDIPDVNHPLMEESEVDILRNNTDRTPEEKDFRACLKANNCSKSVEVNGKKSFDADGICWLKCILFGVPTGEQNQTHLEPGPKPKVLHPPPRNLDRSIEPR